MGNGERIATLEVGPKVAYRLPALVVRSTDSEAAFDLASKLPDHSAGAFTNNEKIVCLPPKVFGLKVNFLY